MKKSIYDTGCNTTIMLSLRRTLVRSGNLFSNAEATKARSFSGKDVCLSLCFGVFVAKQFCTTGKWIWYPGNFEVVLANKVQNHRAERNTFFPVFWKVDSAFNFKLNDN